MKIPEFEEQSKAMAQYLYSVIRTTGASQRSIEQELGLGAAILSKILNGSIRLQVSHVLMILHALGITPGQFFRSYYPQEEPPHPVLQKINRLEGTAPEEDTLEFDERVRRALVRILNSEPLRLEA